MSLFEPKSIAVIGASSDVGSVGHDILNNLLTQGYKGDVFPINPKYEELQDKKCFASVNNIEDDIDLAIIVVPAKIVPMVLEECAEKKIQNVVIISAGFSETGTTEGKELEKRINEIAISCNIVGPNCLGIVRPKINLNASFAKELPPQGNVALISQSGATAVAVMDASATLGIGYSLVASIGNCAVMDECDLLEIAEEDDETTVIGFYLESIKDGTRFLEAASQCTKPIVLLKSGVSEKGSEAASSHTGALAGADAGIEALCTQASIVRAHTSEEFLDLLEALSSEPPLPSTNIAIITNAGGPGILATDACSKAKLTLPSLSTKIEAELKKALPDAASTKNPIDVIGDAGVDRYEAALEACGDDPSIDGVAAILTPQVMTPIDEIVDAIITWKKSHDMMPLVTSFMGEENVKDARLKLQKNGVPCFETPERAIMTLGALHPSYTLKAKSYQLNDVRAAAADDIIESDTGLLSEEKIAKLCELYGIPIPEGRLATTEDEAVKIAEDIGYPVIAKISSPDILHKTDIGGIKANLQNEKELRDAYESITSSYEIQDTKYKIRGIFVQKMLEAGNEFIVGATADATFGHLVMAGLGGIYAEMLEDIAFRIAPITQDEAYRLLSELKSWEVLLGMRGKKPLDIDHLAQLIETVSQLVYECPQIKDIDFNPIFVKEDGITVADAKIVIGPQATKT